MAINNELAITAIAAPPAEAFHIHHVVVKLNIKNTK
jgi:hypothetical protein